MKDGGGPFDRIAETGWPNRPKREPPCECEGCVTTRELYLSLFKARKSNRIANQTLAPMKSRVLLMPP